MNSLSSEHNNLLDLIESPADLKKLSPKQLPQLADEIRHKLIDSLSYTGGHLAPNLGVVELTIALHRVFNSPEDKILFDVSHQSYVHKMLTGRTDRFHTIRCYEGISGFMKRSESPHDAFGAGHAGTAMSAALGIAAARDLLGKDYQVIPVIGDGSFACGPSLEALNNIATTTKSFITILNDNKWSIDKNVGSLSKYFASLQATQTYSWLRSSTRKFIEKLAGTEARDQASQLVHAARGLISPLSFFEQLGFTYFGPLDGHDIGRMERVLNIAKKMDKPCIIHVITEKGRGYEPATQNPTKFHGVGCYNKADGATAQAGLTYSEVFGSTLTDMAKEDENIVAITAAMPSGTKLCTFRDQFPKRFYDTGIAEEHAAIFACGLATEGLKPYLAIYSTFMQRCVDMIHHDAALQKLPVRFCMDRAGLSPDDGPTHHGLYDIAMLRCIPDLIMMQPKDEAELCHMLATMNSIEDKPSSIRYPRGEGEGVLLPSQPAPLPIGKAEVLAEGSDIILLALGNMNSVASQVRENLEAAGHSVAHINARFIKPLDSECIQRYAKQARLLVTLEDHTCMGGFGSAVAEHLAEQKISIQQEIIAWPDNFIEHGTLSILREKHGLTPQSITQRILNHPLFA